ncbi:hypothetical protein [Bradyrhizobium sp. 169]|uniref:hypothetical protein n=1 Tax=Bradyrhizobium sp. 169 TaxID=2782640 RepID=UPI001FFBDE25|nr:hypothetical protein [Bradyrhizobium sp. 169]MCK1589198.1 hypothetical protein [Bradyrhizobium sp. 169]
MDEAKGIQAARHQLHIAIGHFRPPPPQPLEISRYVGASLLQKAIRRGRTELAVQAAATLLQQSPERLWRRLACIAFEDVGLGNLDLVALATAAMAGKRVRAPLGGEWAVASYLTSRLTTAIKCRGADDLLLVAENHPSFENHRLYVQTPAGDRHDFGWCLVVLHARQFEPQLWGEQCHEDRQHLAAAAMALLGDLDKLGERFRGARRT